MNINSVLSASNLDFLPSSLVAEGNMEFATMQSPSGRKLAVLCPSGQGQGLEGEWSELNDRQLFLCPLSSGNAAYLRAHLPWLTPNLLGLKTSAGMGDRVGLATEGHVRAVRAFEGNIAPIFAQQSIREMARTNRTPQQVMDDAVWGVFAGGWQGGFGADADHLKTPQDIDVCLSTGHTFFTIDPGEHVDNRAESADLSTLRELATALPGVVTPVNSGLLGKLFDFEGLHVMFDELTLLKAAVKYGRAVAHVTAMYDELWTGAKAMYKIEPAVVGGGEVIVYAPHLDVVSHVHGKYIYQIGYHILPYFLANWEKFKDIPLGVLAHSTHFRGSGVMDGDREVPNVKLTLASKISEKDCRRLGIGYLNPTAIRVEEWQNREQDGILYVPRTGETLYRVKNELGVGS